MLEGSVAAGVGGGPGVPGAGVVDVDRVVDADCVDRVVRHAVRTTVVVEAQVEGPIAAAAGVGGPGVVDAVRTTVVVVVEIAFAVVDVDGPHVDQVVDAVVMVEVAVAIAIAAGGVAAAAAR